MTSWAFFVLLLESVLLSYSGWGSVAVIRAALIENHALLSDGQLTTFLALSQITPGPLGFYLLFVGSSVRGLVGVVIAWAALALPSLLVVPILRLIDRHANVAAVTGAATGVIVASAALMLATGAELIARVVVSPALAGIALASLIVLATARVPSFIVVLAAAAIGAALEMVR